MAVRRKFDAIHEFVCSWSAYLVNSISTRSSTIIPIIMNDDAQGDPMNFKAHPEHASWSEVPYPNCFPDSEIRRMKITFEIIIPKAVSAISSVVRVDYALISCAFPEDLDALDEKSGLTLKEVLEIQKESTDRQVYPLWSAVDMNNASSLHSNVPGLTTNQTLEGVNFSQEQLYDQKRYGKIRGLIKKCMPIGYRRMYIRTNSVAGTRKKITINFTPSNAKYINPYTFLGLLVNLPVSVAISSVDPTIHQPVLFTDLTSDTELIAFSVHAQYNERNPEFHMGKV